MVWCVVPPLKLMFFKRTVGPVPSLWISKVTETLKRGLGSEIEWTAGGFSRWQRFGRRGEAYTAMLKALCVPGVKGKWVKMPINEGETYAFFFMKDGETMYGKICLRKDGNGILIYSAHENEKDQL